MVRLRPDLLVPVLMPGISPGDESAELLYRVSEQGSAPPSEFSCLPAPPP